MKTKWFFIALAGMIIFISCTESAIIKEYGDQIEMDLEPISRVYRNDFDIGAAVEPFQLEDGEGALLSYHYNSLTAENVMKFRSIHPEKDVFDFEGADKLAAFAKENKMKMRGHTFLWHHPNEIAPWVFEDEKGNPRSREEVLSLLKNHMSVLMNRYKKTVYCWDVVNEAIDTSQADNLRRTPWYESIGPDYIEEAFRMAHELDPAASLFLNEYDTFEPQKREAYYQLVKDLLDKGVPIHGVGLQLHLRLNHPEISAIRETLERFKELGLEIHITELDLSLYTQEFQVMETPPMENQIRQAHHYKELFQLFYEYRKVIGSVTFWGFNDSHTWLREEPYNRPDWPLPFDSSYQSKLAYKGIIQSEDLPEDVILISPNQNLTYSASKGTPVIDGEIDPIWENAEIITTSTQVMSSPGATSRVRVLWDEDNLFVLAEVADDTLSNNGGESYMNDSFEVFLDEKNDKTVALGKDDFQYRIDFENNQNFGGYGWKDKIESASVITDEGYRVELKIILQNVKGETGRQMGLDFQVNDNFGNASREGISKWNDPTNESWRNTTGWGTLELIP